MQNNWPFTMMMELSDLKLIEMIQEEYCHGSAAESIRFAIKLAAKERSRSDVDLVECEEIGDDVYNYSVNLDDEYRVMLAKVQGKAGLTSAAAALRYCVRSFAKRKMAATRLSV